MPKFKSPYEAGLNAGIKGGNKSNLDFRYFKTPQDAQEWFKGQRDGEKISKSEPKKYLIRVIELTSD